MSTTVEAPRKHAAAPPEASDRAVAENRLGLKLVAPAVVMMVLVTAWPMLQALYLSLFRYRLTAPDDRQFVECETYVGPDRRVRNFGPPMGIVGRRQGDLSAHVGAAVEPNMEQSEIDLMMKPRRVAL